MVIAQATRIRMILRKTPLKVYSNLKMLNVFRYSFLSRPSFKVKTILLNLTLFIAKLKLTFSGLVSFDSLNAL